MSVEVTWEKPVGEAFLPPHPTSWIGLRYNISRKKQIMEFFCMHINTEVFYKLILSFWVCVSRHAQSSQNKIFTYLCNSPKKVGNEVNFLATNKYQDFQFNFQLITSLWVCVTCHSQSTLNNKFAISLQYLKENVKGETDVLPVD